MLQTLQISLNYTQGRKIKYPYFILEAAKAFQLTLNASISLFTFNWNVATKYTILLVSKKIGYGLMSAHFLAFTNSTWLKVEDD